MSHWRANESLASKKATDEQKSERVTGEQKSERIASKQPGSNWRATSERLVSSQRALIQARKLWILLTQLASGSLAISANPVHSSLSALFQRSFSGSANPSFSDVGEPQDDYDATVDEPDDGSEFGGDYFGTDYELDELPGLNHEELGALEFSEAVPPDDDFEDEELEFVKLDYSDDDDDDNDMFEERVQDQPDSLQYVILFYIL